MQPWEEDSGNLISWREDEWSRGGRSVILLGLGSKDPLGGIYYEQNAAVISEIPCIYISTFEECSKILVEILPTPDLFQSNS